jgi:Protein of unknown function (DUF4012)
VLVVLAIADAAWSGMRARDALEDARDELRAGGAALEDGAIADARSAFVQAERHAEEAAGLLRRPGMRLGGWSPWIGDDVDAIRTLAAAADLAAEAGGEIVDGAEAAGWDGTDLPGFAPGGRIDPGPIRAAAPFLAAAAGHLADASDRVAVIDPDELVEPLRGPVATVGAEITRRADQATTLAGAAQTLPGLLGADGPRTYLVVMFNPSDPRGVGGYPGGYGLLHADGHRIDLDEIQPTSTIAEVPPVATTPEIEARWKLYGSLTSFWNTTYVPDFPTAASLMSAIWKAGGREPVDGVIGADPAFLAALLDVVGSTETPAWPQPITGDTVEDILGIETFRTRSQQESDAWQVAVGSAAWQAILTRRWPALPMGEAVAGAVADRHLMVASARPEEEASLVRMGLAGQVAFPPDPHPLVVPIGLSANRAGAFARFDTQTDIEEAGDGVRRVTATVTLHNDAPADCPSSILCGRNTKLIGGPLGTFAAWVHVYMPEDATGVRIRIDGEPWSWPLEREFDRTVTVSQLVAPPQGTAETVITYEVPG